MTNRTDLGVLQALVKKEASRNLDITQSYKSQRDSRVKRICEKVSFPGYGRRFVVLIVMQITEERPDLGLGKFDNCWPIRDMLKLHLKYKSEASRRQKAQKAGKRIRKALESSSERSEAESEESN